MCGVWLPRQCAYREPPILQQMPDRATALKSYKRSQSTPTQNLAGSMRLTSSATYGNNRLARRRWCCMRHWGQERGEGLAFYSSGSQVFNDKPRARWRWSSKGMVHLGNPTPARFVMIDLLDWVNMSFKGGPESGLTANIAAKGYTDRHHSHVMLNLAPFGTFVAQNLNSYGDYDLFQLGGRPCHFGNFVTPEFACMKRTTKQTCRFKPLLNVSQRRGRWNGLIGDMRGARRDRHVPTKSIDPFILTLQPTLNNATYIDGHHPLPSLKSRTNKHNPLSLPPPLGLASVVVPKSNIRG
ncbi:hypothetical protein BDV93DRAFT_585300 [Ceratobasidium sp. AG-I]|nr:hypothetical protein BDV93DRAFT_585300 [Ceratobasidium sp. AG-I]